MCECVDGKSPLLLQGRTAQRPLGCIGGHIAYQVYSGTWRRAMEMIAHESRVVFSSIFSVFSLLYLLASAILGLLRCGKSCRLRWMNYLRPDIKRGNIGPDEEDLIIRLHTLLGNRWSLIAGRLPGRTDNEIKNYWNTHLSKRIRNRGAYHNHQSGVSEALDLANMKDNKNKNQKNSNCKEKTERSQTQIHVPKPIRLTSFPRDFQVLEARNSSDGKLGNGPTVHGGEVVKDDLIGPWPDLKDGDLLDEEIEHELGFSSRSHGHMKDGMLEKLFGEYLDLLNEVEGKVQLDSFAEPLGA